MRYTLMKKLPGIGAIMDEYFKAMLNATIHASYDPSGVTLFAADMRHSKARAKAVEMHEHVHSALCDESDYGWLYQFLAKVRLHPISSIRRRADDLMSEMMALSVATHEGLACLQELAWIARYEGLSAAANYTEGIPDSYTSALDLAMQCFGKPGNSRLDEYSDYAIHAGIVCCGVALLNNRVYSRCLDPAVVLESDDFAMVQADAPDDRFARLAGTLSDQRDHIYLLFDEAQRYGVNLMDAHNWWDLHEYAIELLNRIVPQIDIIPIRDGTRGVREVAEAWITYLNARVGSPLYKIGFPEGNVEVKAPGRQPVHSIWQERELSKGYVLFDPSLRRGIRAPNIPFSWDEFINFQTALGARQNIFWMILLGTDPSTVPPELLSHCRVLVSSIPMWFGSVSMESPLTQFYPSSTVEEGTMEQLIRDSRKLIDSGCVWYSDIGRI